MTKYIKLISGLLCSLLLFQIVTSSLVWHISAEGQASQIKINFQTDSSDVPTGYMADAGQTFGSRNGYAYGWNTDHSGMAEIRNVHSDSRLDSFILMKQDAYWEIDLTNGTYDVTVSVGDAVYGSMNTINLEGVDVWTAAELNPGQYLLETKTVTVNDGKLTIDQGGVAEGQILFESTGHPKVINSCLALYQHQLQMIYIS